MTKVTPNFKQERPIYFFREWRKHRGLTQYRLAVVAEVSREGIRKIENGTVQPTMATLEKLAIALGVTTNSLVRGR